jgi:hypothetical protein
MPPMKRALPTSASKLGATPDSQLSSLRRKAGFFPDKPPSSISLVTATVTSSLNLPLRFQFF